MKREPEYVRVPDERVFAEDPPMFCAANQEKGVGDLVFAGEDCCELELAKCVVPIPATVSGVITKVMVADETPLELGQAIYEVIPLDGVSDFLDAAKRILVHRFSDAEAIFDELLERVHPEHLEASLKVLAEGTPEQIILQLAKG